MIVYCVYDLKLFRSLKLSNYDLSFLTGCPNLSHHGIFLAHLEVFLILFRLSNVKHDSCVMTVMLSSKSGLLG